MPIQDLIAEHAPSLLQSIARVVAGAVRFVFVHLLVNLVLFNVGRAALLVVTLGRYPRGRALLAHEGRIAFCGILVVMLLWAAIAAFNHFSKVAIGA
jgi:hypothetical protein